MGAKILKNFETKGGCEIAKPQSAIWNRQDGSSDRREISGLGRCLRGGFRRRPHVSGATRKCSEGQQNFCEGQAGASRARRRTVHRLLRSLRQRPDRRSFLVIYSRTPAKEFEEIISGESTACPARHWSLVTRHFLSAFQRFSVSAFQRLRMSVFPTQWS
jgi:hypothetical protein